MRLAFFLTALLMSSLIAAATPSEAAFTPPLAEEGDSLFCGFHNTPLLIDDDGFRERKTSVRRCPLSGKAKIANSFDHGCCLKSGHARAAVESSGGGALAALRPSLHAAPLSLTGGGLLTKTVSRYSSLTLPSETPPPQI